jgi:hypothetical protein
MMAPERLALLAELALGVLAAAVFIVAHGRGPWRFTPEGRQLMGMAVASGGELATLLAVLLGWRPPWLLLIAGYGLIDVVMVRWVWLLLRAQHRDSGPGETTLEEKP